MTMQSHAYTVHPANSAEVISDVSLQMARFRNSRSDDLARASCRTTLPGKRRYSTLPARPALPDHFAGRDQPYRPYDLLVDTGPPIPTVDPCPAPRTPLRI